MTPLALELAQDVFSGRLRIISPQNEWPEWRCKDACWRIVHEAKFFDCSAVWTDIVLPLAQSMHETFEKHDRFDSRLAFLPAALTWLEAEISLTDLGLLVGIPREDGLGDERLTEIEKRKVELYRLARVFIASHDDVTSTAKRLVIERSPFPDRPRAWRLTEPSALPLVHSGLKPERSFTRFFFSGAPAIASDKPVSSPDDFVCYAALAMINTPRVVGQRVHHPHERLEREKIKAMNLVGKFPLRAWTEIVLKVAPPDVRTGQPAEEGHLTGEKCLHFCRSFLRIKMGRLEYVTGHWRGNPALGIKRSRYRLENEANE